MRRLTIAAAGLLFLISCGNGKAVFICDNVYAATTVEPCGIERSLRRALRDAGYGYDYTEIPVNSILSDFLPEKAAVIVLSPFLAKQAEACAAGRPETVFVTLEQQLTTRLPNLKGLPRRGETGYAELGRLFGKLSRERIPDPFRLPGDEKSGGLGNGTGKGTQQPADSVPAVDGNVSDEMNSAGSDEDFPSEWEPEDTGADSTVLLKPAIVFANLSTGKEKNYLAFINAFADMNPQASASLVSLDVPPSRDAASLGRLSDELISRQCNLIFIDAGSATPQIIGGLSDEPVLLALFPAPPDDNVPWKNIDLVLEWDYPEAFKRFFSVLNGNGEDEVFLELKIKKYKKDSILYPYYAEKIIDK